ncbi:4Fe-4S dicluster domain-containing protein [Clostridia bacterium OttesenSCG-928-O13]|nr:4Fe-4S dicluster domain-containing protein [Clostridia bacterium OttesenSCG-928-O13]
MADVIKKETLRKLLAKLAETMTLVGPVDTGKVVEYKPTTADAVLMDDRISYKSPKEYYFPQVEKMMTFTGDEAVENTEAKPTVIFGAKPCDLEALRVMQAVFLEGRYADPFFARHMDKNLIIGVGCVNKKPGCFCDELGLDMGFSDFCDILLNEGKDGYTVEYLSEKGKEALAALPETAKVKCDNARKAKKPEGPVLGLPAELDDAALFEAVDWAKLTETCQGCGMCTFICPTCHCFEFKDVTAKNGDVERYRCWDSCIYPKFTLHASGHNPRATRAERYRQRVLHKYLYVKKNTGYTACTGCGRCVRSCPVGMNIKKVAKAAMEVAL